MKYLQLDGRERLQIQADVQDLDFSESPFRDYRQGSVPGVTLPVASSKQK